MWRTDHDGNLRLVAELLLCCYNLQVNCTVRCRIGHGVDVGAGRVGVDFVAFVGPLGVVVED
jgi:hypothetical protein